MSEERPLNRADFIHLNEMFTAAFEDVDEGEMGYDDAVAVVLLAFVDIGRPLVPAADNRALREELELAADQAFMVGQMADTAETARDEAVKREKALEAELAQRAEVAARIASRLEEAEKLCRGSDEMWALWCDYIEPSAWTLEETFPAALDQSGKEARS